MDVLTFGTTNEGKLKEVSEILGIKVEGIALEVDEIQSLDRTEVALKKAKAYFQEVNKPLLVEDNSLEFKGLNGLPGTFIDYFFKSLGNEGLVELLSHTRDRSATAYATLVYYESDSNYQIFTGEQTGKIAKFPRGDNGFGWDPIFIPDGDNRTLAELEPAEKAAISMRKKALAQFQKWILENNK